MSQRMAMAKMARVRLGCSEELDEFTEGIVLLVPLVGVLHVSSMPMLWREGDEDGHASVRL
jgi:hypothetical protein